MRTGAGFEKQIEWIGSSQKDIRDMPEDVKDVFGYALHLAQIGKKHGSAKALKGFGGGGVLEVVEDDDGNTYRAVYTVKFSTAVYVLDVFQKKSAAGVKTPDRIINRIKDRLRVAEERHKEKNAREAEDRRRTR